MSATSGSTEIAVVGMSGRFPGARTLDEYWRNLRDGVESRTELSDRELAAAGVSAATLADPSYVKAAMVLPDMEMFDAGFFGLSPRDAAIMDPQHRQFLECAWHALESAGHVPRSFPGAIAVFAGSGHHAYLSQNLLPNRELLESVGFFLLRHTGNDKDFLTTRVSYLLDLTGPSVNVQTACSTSLVAIHLACQSLLGGECDMALAGGVTIELPHRQGYTYREGEILSPDGHCRSFDARSQGTVFGSGVGVVVLRRLEDALADGDFIHAVILGSAVNNDGSTKVGYLAPSVDGQAQAITEAIGVAGIDAGAISYVEAHGTGTPVGDPIEITALTQAFRQTTQRRGFCAVGSVKTNIGHLDTAAGVAGLIKVALALQHRRIPPTLHFERANPAIDFAGSPFHVNARLAEWKSDGAPRRAAVSSLGVGGTNACVILQEPPAPPPPAPSRPAQILVLSAKTPAALEIMSRDLGQHLRDHPDLSLPDVAYTLQVGRRDFAHRRAVVCGDAAAAARALLGEEVGRVLVQASPSREPRIAFMFPGGGAQYLDMGRELYRVEPGFREEVDRCAAILRARQSLDLLPILYPPGGAGGAALTRTSAALPALFTVEIALARLLMSWGIRPQAMIGHSLGEYTAACLSGVLSLEEALALVTLRGRLFETLPEGAMTSVPLSEDALRERIGDALSIAAVNAPSLCTVSGPVAAIAALEAALAAEDIETRRLHISVAAHSSMLAPILHEMETFARRLRPQPMRIPYVSNVTGTWMTAADAADPTYWVRHLRGSVRFSPGLSELFAEPDRLLVEVGPGTTLASLARQHPRKVAGLAALSTMRHPQDPGSDHAALLAAVGGLWLAGAPVDWAAFSSREKRRRVPLPAYPFERRRHWIDAPSALSRARESTRPSGRRDDVGDWFYTPCWRRAPLGEVRAAAARILVLTDPGGLGARLAARLRSEGHEVITAGSAAGLGELTVGQGRREDYGALLRALAERGSSPERIVHAFCAGAPGHDGGRREAVEAAVERGFFSLMHLAQAIGDEDPAEPIEVTVLSSGLHAAGGAAVEHPENALLLGPCLVIPQEYPKVPCRSVDLPVSPGDEGELLARLCREIAAPIDETVVAYRGSQRLSRSFAPARIEEPPPRASLLKERGVYLITGGLGGLGATLADHLARTVRARLVLVGRTGLPAREQWPRWLELHLPSDWTSRLIARVRALEAAGAEVLVAGVDVSDEGELRALVARAEERFGGIDGVFHAAGVLRDGLIQDKDRYTAESVLAPKLWGTLALDAALRETKLDFLVLFSSVSALSGLPGQVDYAAANAFLGAYAEARRAPSGRRTVAVDWSAWQEVGMAAMLARGLGPFAAPSASGTDDDVASGLDPAEAFAHPILKQRRRAEDGPEIYSAQLGIDEDWILREHRLPGGDALIPGTGYLELARAALAAGGRGGENGAAANGAPVVIRDAIEIRDAVFLSPFLVKEGERRSLRLELTRQGRAAEFVIAGRSSGGPWTDHARGRVAFVDAPPPERLDVAAILARCPEREAAQRHAHVIFGPRWGGIREAAFGSGEALVTIELPPAFAADLDHVPLHPALLDLATGFAQPLIEGWRKHREFYVPFSYGQVCVRGPLPRRFHSHVRLRSAPRGSTEVVTFDVTLVDEEGVEVVSAREFVMRRIGDAAGLTAARGVPVDGARAALRTDAPVAPVSPALALRLKDGILPAEGMDVLDRILASGAGPHLVVSPRDLEAVLAEDRQAGGGRGAAGNPAAAVSPSGAQARPSVAYVAPRTEVERLITDLLEEMLGIEKVGVHDDFFAIGGHSLLAVRLFNRLHKRTGVNLPLATLFQAPTAAELARRFGGSDPEANATSPDAGPSQPPRPDTMSPSAEPTASPPEVEDRRGVEHAHPWSSLVRLQPRGSRLPFFCVHAKGGNVLNYAALVPHLGPDQPLFGLQSRGLDGSAEPFRHLSEMASHYLTEIRTVQPRGPYLLGGGSMGGMIAYEMARQIRAEGDEVGLVVMFDTYGPYHVRFERSDLSRRIQQGILGKIERRFTVMRSLDPREQMGELGRIAATKLQNGINRAACRAYRGMGRPLPHALRYWDLEMLNLDVIARYVPRAYPGKIVLFRSAEQPPEFYPDPALGWSGWAQGGVEVIEIPGTHDDIVEQPRMLERLRACLDEVAAARVTP